ncbi:Uncharacterised protein [Moraxella caprae]|uniref:Uncharacterized protein n=1 Tax=Moraxella caprae TaxID=90240 RepID=A0A378QYJ1_9GAMM|nr:DUF1778 domain-containing protein [Moraxella caprae]STZ08034.1 Uncharacterised protein [Moraxella caprae]
MILDLPPHIEHAITTTAKEQGLTVIELLARDYMVDDLTQSWALTHQDKAMLQELLDSPPAPTPKLLALFDSHKDFNKAVANAI